MIKILRLYIIVTLISLFAVSFASAANNEIIRSDSNLIQYTGRIDLSNSEAPRITWPGSMIKANFSGTSISVILDDDFGKNYFNVFLDNDWDNPIVIHCQKGRKEYLIADNLSAGDHSITLTKRTDGREGGTRFYGLLLDQGAQLNTPPVRPSRRIEFYGDSITSGLGNEAPLDAGDKDLAEKNNFLSYAAITARSLNAEHVSISASGIGLMVSWFDWTMPDYYDQLDGTVPRVNDKKWDFSLWTPDVVVVNLMQNDSWLVDSRLNPTPTESQRIQAYYEFIHSIRSKYPDTYIIGILGSMDAVKKGSKWPGYIKKAIEQYRVDFADTKIDSFFFEYAGYNKHPRVAQHREMSKKLTQFISNKMNW